MIGTHTREAGLFIILAMSTVALIVVYVKDKPEQPELRSIGKVNHSQGGVYIRPDEYSAWLEIEKKQNVWNGSFVSTGVKSEASIILESGKKFLLGADSQLFVQENTIENKDLLVNLLHGSIKIEESIKPIKTNNFKLSFASLAESIGISKPHPKTKIRTLLKEAVIEENTMATLRVVESKDGQKSLAVESGNLEVVAVETPTPKAESSLISILAPEEIKATIAVTEMPIATEIPTPTATPFTIIPSLLNMNSGDAFWVLTSKKDFYAKGKFILKFKFPPNSLIPKDTSIIITTTNNEKEIIALPPSILEEQQIELKASELLEKSKLITTSSLSEEWPITLKVGVRSIINKVNNDLFSENTATISYLFLKPSWDKPIQVQWNKSKTFNPAVLASPKYKTESFTNKLWAKTAKDLLKALPNILAADKIAFIPANMPNKNGLCVIQNNNLVFYFPEPQDKSLVALQSLKINTLDDIAFWGQPTDYTPITNTKINKLGDEYFYDGKNLLKISVTKSTNFNIASTLLSSKIFFARFSQNTPIVKDNKFSDILLTPNALTEEIKNDTTNIPLPKSNIKISIIERENEKDIWNLISEAYKSQFKHPFFSLINPRDIILNFRINNKNLDSVLKNPSPINVFTQFNDILSLDMLIAITKNKNKMSIILADETELFKVRDTNTAFLGKALVNNLSQGIGYQAIVSKQKGPFIKLLPTADADSLKIGKQLIIYNKALKTQKLNIQGNPIALVEIIGNGDTGVWGWILPTNDKIPTIPNGAFATEL